MKKMTLNLDALQVDSFETDRNGRAFGTVRAHSIDTVSNTEAGVSDLTDCPDESIDPNTNTGFRTCGDGDVCTAGFSEWIGCTNHYKNCTGA